MSDELHIGTHENLRVIRSDSDAFEVEARYLPNGGRPPHHLHPVQDEHFEILQGVLHVEVAGQVRDLGAGEQITVARRQVHRMWNDADQPTLVRWVTTPALGTAQWFAGLAALQARAEQRGHTRPDLLGFARHARRHRDTFRLVVAGSPALGGAAVGILAAIGGLTGPRRRTGG